MVEREVAEKLLEEYADMPHYPAQEEGKVKLAAGWLIDKAGLKGYKKGNVGVHERQALVLVNLGGATGGEVIAFAQEVVATVKEKFGIEVTEDMEKWAMYIGIGLVLLFIWGRISAARQRAKRAAAFEELLRAGEEDEK
jgi:hypothetical protein